MSRIGKQPITLPDGVSAETVGNSVKLIGPQGTLVTTLPAGTKLTQNGAELVVETVKSDAAQRNYGLARTLVANMVRGVAEGFSKQLEIQGVGYRAALSGDKLNLQLGFSHPVEIDLPEGITAKVEKNIITLSGPNKYLVGQIAADVRALKKPEPYKGKGIRYVGEHVRRKAGKAAVKGA